MSYQKIEELFSREYLCDKKHKLNTSPKAIPGAILKEIESEGLTLERIEELSRKGYDIYKYSTQITLHGTCEELTKDGRIGWYKSLALNKNKSIGIKWIAVDHAKKERIIDLLGECGWSSVSNSTSFHPIRIKRVNNAAEAKAVVAEWKADIERIDRGLFYGTVSVFLEKDIFGRVYVICHLVVNGIKERNVDKLIEQAGGMAIAELEAKREKRLEEERKKEEEWDREYKEREAKRKAEAKIANETFYERLEADGYVEAVSNKQPVGTVILLVCRDFDNRLIRNYYRIEKRTARPCDENGENNYGHANRQKLIKEPCKCYVKATA